MLELDCISPFEYIPNEGTLVESAQLLDTNKSLTLIPLATSIPAVIRPTPSAAE